MVALHQRPALSQTCYGHEPEHPATLRSGGPTFPSGENSYFFERRLLPNIYQWQKARALMIRPIPRPEPSGIEADAPVSDLCRNRGQPRTTGDNTPEV